jgi:hypothetical protein
MARQNQRSNQLGNNFVGDIPVVNIAPGDVSILSAKLADLQYPMEYVLTDYENPQRLDSWDYFKLQSQMRVSGFLAQNILDPLKNFERDPLMPAIVFTGFPVEDSLPPTPSNGRRPNEKKSALSESILTGVAQWLGPIFSFKEEFDGAPIHQVVTQNNDGDRTSFKSFSDNAFVPTPFRPTYTAFFGLRNEGNITTAFYPVRDILNELEPPHIQELRRRYYRLKSPSHLNLGRPFATEYDSIFYTDSRRRECIQFTSLDDVEPQNTQAAEALALFRDRIEKDIEPLKINIAPGTLCLVRNSLSIFGYGPEQGHQWLQRIYLAKRLIDFQQKTRSEWREFSFKVDSLLQPES